MMQAKDYLSCDWGTTSFRLRWVRGLDGVVLGEVRTGDGAKVLHGRLVAEGRAGDGQARAEVYREVLGRAVMDLGSGGAAGAGRVPAGTPVMVSGMASSSLGWCELGYAPVPCGVDGSGLRVEAVGEVEAGGLGYPVWMVSGLATGTEMMRGEETELVGVLALPEAAGWRAGCLVVLPGTHSKHVRVDGGRVVDFRTHMTGELLETLSRHTVLAASVVWPLPEDAGGDAGAGGGWVGALEDGVRTVRDAGLSRALFQVRVRSVMGRVDAGLNGWFLAGLLMGAEVMDLAAWEPAVRVPVVVAGAARVVEAYRAVFRVLGWEDRFRAVTPERLRDATVRAHGVLLERIGGRGRTDEMKEQP